MVARITTPKRIMDALNYNEQKVKKGIAECIAAGNYLRDLSSMNFYQKLAGIENRNVLNDRATTMTLHVLSTLILLRNYRMKHLLQLLIYTWIK